MQRVASLADMSPDRLLQVDIAGTKLVLVRHGDEVRAFAGTCPHAGAPLADGAVCNGRIVCPWHKATFSTDDGGLVEPPALKGLQLYNVEIVDGDVWISDTPTSCAPTAKSAEPPSNDLEMLVIGGGAGGAAGVAALREFGCTGRIVLVGREPEPPYDRTSLSKFVMSGQMAPADVPPLLAADFFEQSGVERIVAAATRLDPASRTVWLDDGRSMTYTSALVAPGAAPQHLTLPGGDLQNIHTLRSAGDASLIDADLHDGAKVIVVGSSFIGLEVAASLRERGHDVTVIAIDKIPFVRQFGPQIGQMVKTLHQSNGVRFVSTSPLARFAGETHVRAAILEDGTILPADLVVVGIGVKPVTDFLHGVDRQPDGGIAVDAGMRAAPGLYIAGDAATFPRGEDRLRIEHWRVAQQQARVAAANMIGGEETYIGVPFFWTYHFGKRIEYLGHATQWDETIIDGSLEEQNFLALLAKRGEVVAVVACQRERETAILAERLRHKLTIAEARNIYAGR
jgi:NADPH-dependent 2,4-dienoyl-CoA reductase/sulfur reductase-like enzyme/nitrite reductase/ring-hydroxylating ferredoxin subunit